MVKKKSSKQSGLAEKTEQILLTMPRIIATQIGKDLVVQKQQEGKLKLELKKLGQQKKVLTGKIKMLKMKNTAVSKKQASSAQKNLQKNQKMINALMRTLEAVSKQVQTLSQKKAMYTALQSQLLGFQKDWVKKMSSKPQAKSAGKAKKRKSAPKTKEMKKSSTSFTSMREQPLEAQSMGVFRAAKEEEAEFAQEEMVESV